MQKPNDGYIQFRSQGNGIDRGQENGDGNRVSKMDMAGIGLGPSLQYTKCSDISADFLGILWQNINTKSLAKLGLAHLKPLIALCSGFSSLFWHPLVFVA
jgi:hypothetical protein